MSTSHIIIETIGILVVFGAAIYLLSASIYVGFLFYLNTKIKKENKKINQKNSIK